MAPPILLLIGLGGGSSESELRFQDFRGFKKVKAALWLENRPLRSSNDESGSEGRGSLLGCLGGLVL